MGQSPPGKDCNRSGNGMALLNGPTEFGILHPVPTQWTTTPLKKASLGDLLFCVRGATAGRMNWSDSDYAIGRGIASIRHRGGHQYQRYLRSLLEHRMPTLLTGVTGSTFPNLSYETISGLRVPNPNSLEQEVIGATLEYVDQSIASGRKAGEGLRKLKESASDALLTGRVRVPTKGN